MPYVLIGLIGYAFLYEYFLRLMMVLCMLTATNVFGYEMDFRLIPYFIGSLYGGLPTLVVLTFIYIALRIPMLDSGWETLSFVLSVAGFVLLMVFSIRPFQRASSLRKEHIGVQLMSDFMLYFIITVTGFISVSEESWSSLAQAITAAKSSCE